MSHEERAKNLEAITLCIVKHNQTGQPLSVPKLIEKILRDLKVTQQTARGYVDDLDKSGRIEIRNGTVWAKNCAKI